MGLFILPVNYEIWVIHVDGCVGSLHEVLRGLGGILVYDKRVHLWCDFWATEEYPLHIYALQPIPLEQLDVVKQNLRWMKVHGIGASLGIFCLIIYPSESQ